MSEDKTLWHVLSEIKEDLRALDQKFETHSISSSEDRVRIQGLVSQVNTLNKIITQGNGQESVLVRLSRVQNNIEDLKEDLGEIKQKLNIDTEHKSAIAKFKASRWSSIGKLAGLASLALPGILALLAQSCG